MKMNYCANPLVNCKDWSRIRGFKLVRIANFSTTTSHSILRGSAKLLSHFRAHFAFGCYGKIRKPYMRPIRLPTRELAQQIQETFDSLGILNGCEIDMYGGMNGMDQARLT
ncbi:AKR_HP2_G0023510.mRNA.1.CDS.1 [Saccharomyces cerevisiae]|nr:AKR_HP2_G0023510.mRNA.1.CDS.1 [Saccharomyces cerevisiae]CAI6472737.1 AKR_HP2_G0023510.mRNA.1.CDS.1 [Saccharomyces cerevisiae]